jgi:ADP-ribose pyrophosphatase YjhB (NUDIX family)
VKILLAKTWRALSLPTNFQLSLMRVFQDQFLIGVTGVIFNDKNEVLLFKHSYRQLKWSLPGGYVKSKEHPFEGLEREIEEESGLIISADEQVNIRTDRKTSRMDITIIGKYIGGEFKSSHEVSEYGFFSFETLPRISKNQLLVIERAISSRE